VTMPQWEACKVCGGDHWTKDHPDLRLPPEKQGPMPPDRHDNGLAALAAALNDAQIEADEIRLGRDLALVAKRILGERGVFLPDGLPHDWATVMSAMSIVAHNEKVMAEIAEDQDTIATLRTALDGLVEAASEVTDHAEVHFHERPSTPMWWVDDRRFHALRAALAHAKEGHRWSLIPASSPR
jgi:hypothetical protein